MEKIITKTNELNLNSVAGYKEEKAEAIKIINMFKKYESLRKLGVSVPRGLILSGQPGVGKTLMARVISAEAGVPMFEYGEYDEEAEEESVAALKSIYEEARKAAPSIVLIEEIDKIVEVREYRSDYSRAMLKAIQNEIDGTKNNDGVLTIATTNYYKSLPNALLRSGRMDKHIHFDLPKEEERKAILEYHSKNIGFDLNVSFKEIANRTEGFSGADLKTLINETILNAVATDKTRVNNTDFYEIIPTIAFKGIKKNNDSIEDYVCYHELGHFICEYVLNDSIPEISVQRIGNVNGHIHTIDKKGPSSYEEYKNKAIVLLGGYAAEMYFMGQAYNGSYSDFKSFDETITEMAASGMLGSEYIFSTLNNKNSVFDSEYTADTCVKDKCFNEYVEIAHNIIKENEKLIRFLEEKLKAMINIYPDDMKELINEFKGISK